MKAIDWNSVGVGPSTNTKSRRRRRRWPLLTSFTSILTSCSNNVAMSENNADRQTQHITTSQKNYRSSETLNPQASTSYRGGGGAVDRARREFPDQVSTSSKNEFEYKNNIGSVFDGESSDGGSDDTDNDFHAGNSLSYDNSGFPVSIDGNNLTSSQQSSPVSSSQLGGESYSQPFRTLKKLQTMLDETDYAIASPNSPRLKNPQYVPQEPSNSNSQTKDKTGGMGTAQVNNSAPRATTPGLAKEEYNPRAESYDDHDIPATLWSSKDRAKYKRQQQLHRQYADARTHTFEDTANEDMKSFHGDETDSEGGMDYTLPNLPVYFSDTEPIEAEPSFQAKPTVKSESSFQSKSPSKSEYPLKFDPEKERRQHADVLDKNFINNQSAQRPSAGGQASSQGGRAYPNNFIPQSSPYSPQGQVPPENVYARQYYPQQPPPYYPPPYPYQQQTGYQGYAGPPNRQRFPMYPTMQSYGQQMIYPGSSSVAYPPGMYPMSMQGPVQHLPHPGTAPTYGRPMPKDMPKAEPILSSNPPVHVMDTRDTAMLSKTAVEVNELRSPLRACRKISFDSIQKLMTMTVGVVLISFCAVSPRSLSMVEYSNKMRANLQTIGLSFVTPLLVLLLVVNRNENDIDSMVKTFYHSAVTGYGVALMLEIMFTTIARLIVFRFMEPGIFSLAPKVPLILLPWTLREYSYRPKRITLFAADFFSSCLVSPIVEEWVKFAIMQAVTELPKNFNLSKRKMPKKKRHASRKRRRGPTLDLIVREPGEKQVICINPYISHMLAASIGLKLADNIRRVMSYTKANDANKSFYAFMRGVFPIHELCGTLTALQLARRDVLGRPIPTWEILLPAVVLHGMANFRGMKPLFKWISSTPWSEMQMTPFSSMNEALRFKIGSKTFSQLMWVIILGRVLGYCIKNYYMVCRQAVKRTTTYASNQAAFSAELEAADLLKKKQNEK